MQSSHNLPDPLQRASVGLLVALDALLTDQSVTLAARRCGLTPSGMSHALSQLRTILNDDLLVRVGNAMHPTPRATQLHPPLRRMLTELQLVVADTGGWDPRTSRRTARIETSDAAAIVFAPALTKALRAEAPGVTLEIRPLDLPTLPTRLESGELDLAVTAAVPDAAGLATRTLYREQFVCLLREGHRALRGRWDLDRYLSLDHVVIGTSAPGRSGLDERLASMGRTRNVVLRVGFFLAVPAIVANSDLVVTMPARTAALLRPGLSLREKPFPMQMGGGGVSLLWHERFNRDPFSIWLRKLVASTC